MVICMDAYTVQILLLQLRGVRVGRGAKVRVEGMDSEDWTAVDMGMVMLLGIASYPVSTTSFSNMQQKKG